MAEPVIYSLLWSSLCGRLLTPATVRTTTSSELPARPQIKGLQRARTPSHRGNRGFVGVGRPAGGDASVLLDPIDAVAGQPAASRRRHPRNWFAVNLGIGSP
ncbi:hypothetical protein GUJ93_ZPchr0012g19394 [Zizania palustris]|uniref:Uncharacterized protein n=1 Tax=Zizania palustris TaxID=103762 RepID=A0A8J5WPF4_ZIZPA|nr:hypothetical protein GUJ93_ZPchr0012g19394 [Zizania palustris]